jgi:competence protein ComEA
MNKNTIPNKLQHLLSIALCLALLAGIGAPLAAAAASGVVNVNDAEAAELQLLPRVGPAVAQRIIDYRAENGSFKTKEDLMLVRGIGEQTFEQLAPYITLEGPTTLSEKVTLPRNSASTGDASESNAE